MTWHKFINSYYCFRVWISKSSLRVISISKSKISFRLGTSLITVITISEFKKTNICLSEQKQNAKSRCQKSLKKVAKKVAKKSRKSREKSREKSRKKVAKKVAKKSRKSCEKVLFWTRHKFSNSYYYLRVWIGPSSITVIILRNQKLVFDSAQV